MKFNGVVFPIDKPRVTMPFKATETKWYSDDKPHRGVDIAPFPGSYGEPVYAPIRGGIALVNDHPYAGKELVISGKVPYAFGATGLDGKVYTIDAGEPIHFRMTHHQSILVTPGEFVVPGQVVAKIGSTGMFTTGPHVHVELHMGAGYPGRRVLDPLDFFIAAIPGLAGELTRPW